MAKGLVFIIGGCGFIGRHLRKKIEASYAMCRCTKEKGFDITDADKVQKVIEILEPSSIILLAAVTDVSRCEREYYTYCKPINVQGVQNVLAAGAYTVLLSTDHVFRGDNGPYNTLDERQPVNLYGLSKMLAEDVVLAAGGLVIRTTAVYGSGDRFLSPLRDLKQVGVPDEYTTPTRVENLVNGIIDLVDARVTGVCHIAGPEFISRYEFVKRELRDLPIEVTRLPPRAYRPVRGGLV